MPINNPNVDHRVQAPLFSDLKGETTYRVGFGDSATADAFGRMRTSTPTTLFDSKQLFDNQPLFWDDKEVSGSGTTSVHSTDTASTVIGVSTATAGKRVRQTFQRFNYQPGKSQLIFLTGTVGSQPPDVAARVGIFDENDGIFFVNTGTVNAFVIRSSYTGSPVDTLVSQANWNLDTLDGSGPSGLTLDSTKSQIIVIDFEWLGVGRVRVGFVINGAFYYVHQFNHANLSSGVYMSTPNLPLRYEIENGGTGNASTLEHICSTVISEGGLEKTGVLRHVDSPTNTSLSAGTTYAKLGIRLKESHVDAAVVLENISALCTTANDQAHWELWFNPTISGTFTYIDQTNSAVQVASGTGAIITAGTEIDGGYFSTALPVNPTAPNALRLGAQIGGSPVDSIVLAVRPITNNIGAAASITWRELS